MEINEYIKTLVDNGYKAWSSNMSLTCWPENAPKLGIKKNEYCMTRTYKDSNDSTVEIFYIFDGYRSPVLPEHADRITAYSEPDNRLTIIK